MIKEYRFTWVDEATFTNTFYVSDAEQKLMTAAGVDPDNPEKVFGWLAENDYLLDTNPDSVEGNPTMWKGAIRAR